MKYFNQFNLDSAVGIWPPKQDYTIKIDDLIEPEDVVNKPLHYMLFPDMEAIDVIRKTLTTEEFVGYLKGQILKYRLRAGNKDNLQQDIDKAEWYKEYLFDFKSGNVAE